MLLNEYLQCLQLIILIRSVGNFLLARNVSFTRIFLGRTLGFASAEVSWSWRRRRRLKKSRILCWPFRRWVRRKRPSLRCLLSKFGDAELPRDCYSTAILLQFLFISSCYIFLIVIFVSSAPRGFLIHSWHQACRRSYSTYLRCVESVVKSYMVWTTIFDTFVKS